MSEEEKQAIKECERLSKEDYYGDSYFAEKHSIQILLNLLEKQQEENEELKQENKRIKYFSSNLFIDDYIPKRVIKNKLQENKAKTYCKNCDNTCDSYQLCKFLEELLGDE